MKLKEIYNYFSGSDYKDKGYLRIDICEYLDNLNVQQIPLYEDGFSYEEKFDSHNKILCEQLGIDTSINTVSNLKNLFEEKETKEHYLTVSINSILNKDRFGDIGYDNVIKVIIENDEFNSSYILKIIKYLIEKNDGQFIFLNEKEPKYEAKLSLDRYIYKTGSHNGDLVIFSAGYNNIRYFLYVLFKFYHLEPSYFLNKELLVKSLVTKEITNENYNSVKNFITNITDNKSYSYFLEVHSTKDQKITLTFIDKKFKKERVVFKEISFLFFNDTFKYYNRFYLLVENLLKYETLLTIYENDEKINLFIGDSNFKIIKHASALLDFIQILENNIEYKWYMAVKYFFQNTPRLLTNKNIYLFKNLILYKSGLTYESK